jgi:NitT/TauT family transport system substrate-binding protein
MRKGGVLLVAAAWLVAAAAPLPAAAEAGELRVAIQYGLTYLPFHWMIHEKLVEKHARAQGLGEVKVAWTTVAGGNVMQDGILSGNLDIGATGLPAFLTLWAKTRKSLGARGIAAYNALPLKLNTRNPAIRSVKDFGEKDRIAVPAVKASVQAIILQMEAERVFGPGQHGRLDPLTVSRAHPDAVVALMSGRGEIDSHFAAPPFQNQELRTPGIHTVLTAQEVVGGPLTIGLAYTTAKFRDANPKLYRAFLDALAESITLIGKDRRASAEAYLAVSKDKDTPENIVETLSEPGFVFGLTPQNTVKIAQFMQRTGAIATAPADWRELFFPEIHDLPGS